ncbi:MAG: glycerol dehydrogenase, partial [Woeseiaceae bacterium]
MTRKLFDPKTVFVRGDETPPRVLAAPQRYIQGPGVIDRTGRYISSLMDVTRAGILASKRGLGAQGAQIAQSLKAESIESVNAEFSGECSLIEIENQVANLADQKLDCLIAVGGGKVADAGKAIAHRLGVPGIVVPTLASTDAPCSALSLLYTEDGVKDYVEFFPRSPEMVIVDTDVVANASERYLVAGIGDAMATWYEARVCLANPAARNMVGARPTLASCAMGEICAHALFENGEAAAAAVLTNENNEAVEKVVEANTLLSGVGFESGGLALAHAMAVAYTEVDVVNQNYLHGEMVAMGTMAQLAMEQSEDAEKVARFFARVGLPINLEQLSLSPQSKSEFETLLEATLE